MNSTAPLRCQSKFTYCLTEKGVDIVPVIAELVLWGAKHCPTIIDPTLLEELRAEKEASLVLVGFFNWQDKR